MNFLENWQAKISEEISTVHARLNQKLLDLEQVSRDKQDIKVSNIDKLKKKLQLEINILQRKNRSNFTYISSNLETKEKRIKESCNDLV